jgi:hypothetical protein
MHADTTADQVIELAVQKSARLHEAIAHFDEPSGRYALGGVPGVAYFERDHPDRITHESSSPSPAIGNMLDDLAARHMAAAGLAPGATNSHVHALVLLVLTMFDETARERFSLDQLGRRPAMIVALDEEDGKHDPELEVGDAALRAWVPLVAEHAPDAGAQPTVLEFRFFNQRKDRYAPW